MIGLLGLTIVAATPVSDQMRFLYISGREPASVAISILVTPKGRVNRCAVIIPSGLESIDRHACRGLAKYWFKPAVDGDGMASYGLVRQWITWQPESNKTPVRPPYLGMTIALSVLPPNVETPWDQAVNLIVGADGLIERCELVPTDQPNPLHSVACDQAKRHWTTGPAKTKDGSAVRSIQQLWIRFVTGDGSAKDSTAPTPTASGR